MKSDGSESNGKISCKTNMIAYLFLNTCFLAYFFDEYCPLNLINFALCENEEKFILCIEKKNE